MCTSQMFRIENLSNGKVEIKKGKIEELEEERRLWINNPGRYRISRIPCGVCKECRLKYSQEWAFRCMKELKNHKESYMLTLTYDDEHLTPYINKETGEIIEFSAALWKSEHQNFMKRLRKRFSGEKIRFYMCGEYGSGKDYVDWKGKRRTGTERPHFHIIVFGLPIEDLKFHKYSKCEWSKQKNKLFKSATIEKCWGKGFVDINEVNYETCAYVARYVMKKQKGKLSAEYYKERNKTPEYSCCSRMPGIGYQYFWENIDKFKNNEKHFVKTSKGVKEMNPGRYYDKLLEENFPEEFEKIKQARRKRSEEIMSEVLKMTDISHSQLIENKNRKTEKKLNKLIRPLQ